MTDIERDVRKVAERARDAAADLAPLSRDAKDEALTAVADALRERTEEIVAANAKDVAQARENGISEAMIDRLALTPARIAAIADAVREVVDLPDPVGEVVRGKTLPNGLELRQIRVPLGVIGIIYEGRPNVTVDAAALCLKSGNAVLLRGSSSAYSSNTVLTDVIRQALASTRVPVDAVQMVPGKSRESVKHLMRARGLVDVLIPRGGASLIQTVVNESTIPVIETGTGNCHVYVDEAADLDQALKIVLNSKTQRCSVCNASETLLVHAGIADAFLPRALAELREAGVTIHGDERVRSYDSSVVPATEEDWAESLLTWRSASWTPWTRPWRISAPTLRRTPRPSSPTPRQRHAASSPWWTPRPSWSTPPPASPTAASSASVRRSASPPRSCTHAVRWACRN